ncbi:MAG: phosphatase PAP2 family protein [Endomicrobiales bacterium]
MLRRALLPALIFLGVSFVAGGSPARGEVQEVYRFDEEYLKGFVTDTGFIFSAPARWEVRDWGVAAAFLGTTAVLYGQDEKIRAWAQDHRTGTSDRISAAARLFGEPLYTLPLLGAAYLYAVWQCDDTAGETALLSAESMALSGVFTSVLKHAGGRRRPNAGDGPYAWDGPQLTLSGGRLSFPSGHATSAFALATVVAYEYDALPVQLLAYGTATLAALSRVNDNAHWASDAFAGAAIGYWTGRTVYKRHHAGISGSLSVLPAPQGIVMVYRY